MIYTHSIFFLFRFVFNIYTTTHLLHIFIHSSIIIYTCTLLYSWQVLKVVGVCVYCIISRDDDDRFVLLQFFFVEACFLYVLLYYVRSYIGVHLLYMYFILSRYNTFLFKKKNFLKKK